jgi:ubiquinone/menaquinone biosynthesis C-methylase UbiE
MAEQTLTKPKTIFLDPKAILGKVGVTEGQHVVDLGCGGGYFVLAAARIVGDNGVVYGVDVLPSALSAVSSRARLYGLYNVRTVWSNAEVHGGAHTIKDHSVDVVLMIQLLSQSKKHADIFKEAWRMVKPDGAMVIVDWRPDHGYRFGPLASHCITPEQVIAATGQLGWQSAETVSVGPYHFGLMIRQ